MEEEKVVNEDLTNPAPTEGEGGEPKEGEPAQAGDKTPSNLLLQSLKDEREKRRQLEEELEKFKNPTLQPDGFSDEGKALVKEITTLKAEISEIKGDTTKKEVLNTYPILKDKWDDFEEYRLLPDNKGISLKTAAKAYLVDNGMFEKARKGLEKPTGGNKQAVNSGAMTSEEVETLRKNNFKKYLDMVQKGQIVFKS